MKETNKIRSEQFYDENFNWTKEEKFKWNTFYPGETEAFSRHYMKSGVLFILYGVRAYLANQVCSYTIHCNCNISVV